MKRFYVVWRMMYSSTVVGRVEQQTCLLTCTGVLYWAGTTTLPVNLLLLLLGVRYTVCYHLVLLLLTSH